MMTPSVNPVSKLSQELDTARQLTHLLKQEQTLLIDADIESLSTLVQKKAQIMARLADLGASRLDALKQAGYAVEEASMQKWLNSSLPASVNRAAARKSWDELSTLIHTAKEINRTNGLLIGTHASRNQATLQALQGNPSGQVYGADGQTSVQSSRRSLIVG